MPLKRIVNVVEVEVEVTCYDYIYSIAVMSDEGLGHLSWLDHQLWGSGLPSSQLQVYSIK